MSLPMSLPISLHWPLALLVLLAVPALAAGYVWTIRRRRRSAVPYPSVVLVRAARPGRVTWRRHLPVALLLAALACLGLASARPQVRTDVPVTETTVILALDVSGSMCATDVNPNRLTAAQAAVRDFVRAQDSGTRIGLVVFSGFAQVAVAPTIQRDDLLAAIDSLTTGRGTTIGAAILKSVDAIAQINPNVPATGSQLSFSGDADPPSAPPAGTSFAPEVVVLLTDGANTAGISPGQAAKVAASRGVRIYPIGFGTTNPTSLACTAEQMGGTRFEQPGGFGTPGAASDRQFLVADEPTLREVATITGGTYFSAKGADQLQHVLADLPRHVTVQQRDVEVTAGLAGLAALLVLAAARAAARWTTFPA